jgi:methionyl-tRNA formyltransferase
MNIKIGYAGNHKIGMECLKILLSYDIKPLVLLLPEKGDYNQEMISLLHNVPCIIGKIFREKKNIEFLDSLELDYIISVHFPYLFTKEILELPKIGILNLHPAYLPFNRGWHTPTWAIYESTPFGATLHWVDEEIDSGDIALQKQITISWSDTAHTLYQKALQCEIELFNEAIPYIINKNLPRIPQPYEGTLHLKKDLEKIKKIDLSLEYSGEKIINLLRALTTNNWDEAAFFELDGKKYLIHIEIKED